MHARPIVLLDLGMVLLEFDFKRFARAAARLSPFPPDEILRLGADAPIKLNFDSGRLQEDEFLDQLSSVLQVSGSNRDALREAWADLFTIIPGAEAAYEAIEAQADIWILSDTDPIHHRWVLERFPFVGRARGFVASYAVGALKRDRRPFEVALERTGSLPGRTVFVDDRPENIEVALALGLRAVLFTGWPGTLWPVQEAIDRIVRDGTSM